MNDSHNHRRRLLIIILGLAVAFFIAAKPVTAHAWDWLDIGSIAYEAVLDLIIEIFVTINSLLTQLLDAMGIFLKWVLSLEIVTQLPVIEDAWGIIRDMCNLVFIVVFIGIAFGTIFNAIGLFKAWHYRTALMPLIIAAIVMNFSLAIGKAVVLASNEAAKKVLEIVGDPGGMLIRELKPQTLAMGVDQNARSQLAAGAIYDSAATRTDVEEQVFLECLKEERPPAGDDLLKIMALRQSTFGISRFFETKFYKGVGDCNAEILANRAGTTTAAIAQAGQQIAARERTVPKGNIEQKILFIADSIFNSLMIVMLVLCLGSAAIFLGLRIIMIWVLLATSALAWASYAIPGDNAGFHKWWTHMIAWNVFGPLYLLSLIPGLIMVGGSGEIMLQLQSAGGDFPGMLVQQFFFYAFAVLIFVGYR